MNSIELIRRHVVSELFEMDSVKKNWPTWLKTIRRHADDLTPKTVLELGSHLSEVFQSTNDGGGRSQTSLSGGGYGWEALVCWYTNLCLIGSNAIAVKKPRHIPNAVSEALSVRYANRQTNSESDLVLYSLPDTGELPLVTSEDVGEALQLLDTVVEDCFGETSVAVVQCKTNWNDNAQIPMLWDIVYQAEKFSSNRIAVGTSAFSLSRLRSFKYCFVTVPSQKELPKAGSTAVARVANLSGGVYIGRASVNGVAQSLKEIFARTEIGPAQGRGIPAVLSKELKSIATKYDYFCL